MQIERVETFKRKDILLPHNPDGTSVTPLNFTFTYPEAGTASLAIASRRKLPLVLLLNGASVESFWYRRVIGDLASKGFVIASTDYYRPIPSGSPFKPSEQCMLPTGISLQYSTRSLIVSAPRCFEMPALSLCTVCMGTKGPHSLGHHQDGLHVC